MSEGYKIPIDLSDLDKLIKKFDDAAKAVDRLQEKIDKLKGTKIPVGYDGGRGGRGGGGGGGRGGSGGGGGGGGRGGPFIPQYDLPQHGRAPGYVNPRPSGGGGGGDNGGGGGGGQRVPREPRNPKSDDPGETAYKGWSRVISRGIISLAQAAMQAGGVPAYVRTAANALLYGAGAIGPAATAMAGAAAGTVALGFYGRGVGAERRENMYATGSTAAQAGALTAMGNGAAGQAAGFGDVLRSGTFSGAYFRNRGLIDYGPLTINKADNFINAIDIIRREKNKDLKSIIIRESGLSNQSAYVDASQSMFDEFARETRGSIVGEKALKAGQRGISDFELMLDISKKRIGDIATVVAGLSLGSASKNVTDMISGNPLRTFSGTAKLLNSWSLISDIIGSLTGGGDPTPRGKSNSRNMDPLNERTPSNEIVGGGTRVQSSANISQAMSASNAYGLEQAMRIGAFPVY